MANASVTITATNKLNKGLDPAKKQMLEFQNMVQGVEKKLNKAFSIAGVATVAASAIKKLVDVGKQCVSEYSEAEKVFKRLEVVWDNVGSATGKTYAEIMNYADALEKQTYFTGEAIEESALLLAATESLTEEGFERALDASIDLAAALGEDVTSAAQTLAKAIQEPESALSRLKTIGVSFTEDEKEQIKALADANKTYEAQSLILDKIEQKYKGVAKAINDTPAGKLDNMRDVLGDIRENLGGALLDSISPALDSLYNSLVRISNWIAQNSDSQVSEIKNKIYEASKNGGHADLSGYSTDALLKAVDSAVYDAEHSDDQSTWIKGILDKLGFNQGMTNVADYIKMNVMSSVSRELKDRGFDSFSSAKANTLAPVTVGGSLDSTIVTGLDVEETLSTLLDKVGGSSALYTESKYQSVINEIEGYLAILKNSDGTAQRAYLAEQGLEGSNPTYVIKVLEQILGEYYDKIDALTPTQPIEPTDLENFLSDYGNLSTTKQANEIKSAMNKIAEIYSTASGGEQIMLDEINVALMKQLDALYATEKKVEEVTNGTFLDQLSNSFAGVIESLGFGSEESKTAAGALLGTALEGLGEAGEAAETLATNMATMGPLLGLIVTALQYVIKGLMEVLGEVLGEQIMIVVDSLMEIGRAVGQVLLPIIKLLTPILEALLQPLLVFTGALTYAGQALQHWVANLFNNLADWSIGSWHPFGGLRMNDPGSPGNFGDFLSNYMNSYNAGLSSANSASTETALSSASYRGATQVTINIYQMSPVVGENGMRQFAQMIREEFDALDYYGVSA